MAKTQTKQVLNFSMKGVVDAPSTKDAARIEDKIEAAVKTLEKDLDLELGDIQWSAKVGRVPA